MQRSLSVSLAIRSCARALRSLALGSALGLLACASADHGDDLGALKLGLTTQANGITYRLSHAMLALEGPEKRTLSADDQDELELTLPAGAYRLTLLDGFQLVQKDLPDSPAVDAKLVSQNPSPVLISAGETATATLRFELAQSAGSASLGDGKLHVGIEVGAADAGTQVASCALGLRIDELDYEQPNSDDGELIELLNIGSCTADLTDVQLELVNGGDGKVYSRYALHDAAPKLAAGERLVIGDAKVLAALAPELKHMPLNGSGLQNGPDGVRIVLGKQTLDAVAYEDKVASAGEGNAAPADEGAQSLSRCPDGFDTDDNALDFKLTQPSPGAASVCP
jgi:hypothetical protein